MQFPTVVYKSPGMHQCPGSTYSYKGAADDAELADLLESGWFLTLPEALAGEPEEGRTDDSLPTRAELEAKATELGIKFDGRATDAGLLKKINAELEPK